MKVLFGFLYVCLLSEVVTLPLGASSCFPDEDEGCGGYESSSLSADSDGGGQLRRSRGRRDLTVAVSMCTLATPRSEHADTFNSSDLRTGLVAEMPPEDPDFANAVALPGEGMTRSLFEAGHPRQKRKEQFDLKALDSNPELIVSEGPGGQPGNTDFRPTVRQLVFDRRRDLSEVTAMASDTVLNSTFVTLGSSMEAQDGDVRHNLDTTDPVLPSVMWGAPVARDVETGIALPERSEAAEPESTDIREQRASRPRDERIVQALQDARPSFLTRLGKRIPAALMTSLYMSLLAQNDSEAAKRVFYVYCAESGLFVVDSAVDLFWRGGASRGFHETMAGLQVLAGTVMVGAAPKSGWAYFGALSTGMNSLTSWFARKKNSGRQVHPM